MDNMRRIELRDGSSIANDALLNNGIVATGASKPRRKPGPQKKAAPRSEKESCRLTVEEKTERRKYCKKYGIKPADLLRAAYLSATISESDKGKIIYDATIMLRELEVSTGKMQRRLAYEGNAVTAAGLAAINTGIVAVLKRLIMVIPLALTSVYILSLLNTAVVAKYGDVVGLRYELVWLLGWISGALMDLLLYAQLRRHRHRIGQLMAKGRSFVRHKTQRRNRLSKRRR